ncbi:MAG: ABC transporter permease [Microthrixaceae bacterium]
MPLTDRDADPSVATADEPVVLPDPDPAARPVTSAAAGAAPSAGTGGTRGRRQRPLWRIRGDISPAWRITLATVGVLAILAAWTLAANSIESGGALLPSPGATVTALEKMWTEGTLLTDLWASAERILIGYSISVAIGVVVGIAIGSFATFEALLEAPFGFLRYIPATALTPLFLLWLGIGESPKIWLIVVGTVFFNILMVADVARAVPRELLNASYTLGAGRRRILRRVILPHSVPGIVDVARINLAAAWLMLVVAELLAAEEGLAYQIVRAQRFRAVDTMFALLIVFGIIGLVSDLFLRWFRNRVAPWDRP